MAVGATVTVSVADGLCVLAALGVAGGLVATTKTMRGGRVGVARVSSGEGDEHALTMTMGNENRPTRTRIAKTSFRFFISTFYAKFSENQLFVRKSIDTRAQVG